MSMEHDLPPFFPFRLSRTIWTSYPHSLHYWTCRDSYGDVDIRARDILRLSPAHEMTNGIIP
jgi:hypothetical protein